jgi:hypothetical protein
MDYENYKTRILGIDLSEDVYKFLEGEGMEVYRGTYGPKIDAREADVDGNALPISKRWKLPDNIQEYDVIIEDMKHNDIIPYKYKKNSGSPVIEENSNSFSQLCICKPQNMFNPVPLGCYLVRLGLRHRRKEVIKVMFQDEQYKVIYSGKMSGPYATTIGEFNNYLYIDNFCGSSIKGDRVKMTDNTLSHKLFDGLLPDMYYVQTYNTPVLDGLSGKKVPLKVFIPLLTDTNGDIISYLFAPVKGNSVTIMLPQTNRKKELLERVFKEILYKHYSELFPQQNSMAWIRNEEYELPEVIKLEEEKRQILKRTRQEIEQKNEAIKVSHKNLSFLYGMLTDTGDELVNDIVSYLKWLGFEDVKKADDEVDEGGLLQEDIRVELNANDLLIIEVKGVHGTSTDNECAQIEKNILRRFHEHNYHTVYGLYIVNNEMGKEPLKRTLPPFNSTQIQDAKNSCRGLAYTYQLFNLYFEINNGITTKENARKCLLDFGLVDFRNNFKSIDVPYSYFKQNTIICLEIQETEIKVGDFFYFEDGRKRLQKVQIKSIEQEGKPLTSVDNGKTGFGLDKAVLNSVEILIKTE